MSNHIGPKTHLPDRIRKALQAAGTLGLSSADLAQAIGVHGVGTTSMRQHAGSLIKSGEVFMLHRGPAAMYFHGSVCRKAAELRFASHAPALFLARAAKSRATRERAAGKPEGRPAGTTYGTLPRKRHLPAVDPNGLRRDAAVTVPAGVQVQVCPSGQDMRRRADPAHRGEFGSLPIGQYPEPGSSWVDAANEERQRA